jgi:predicted Rossmann fold flavoprotein
MQNKFDVIVIGAGAAGLMTSVMLGQKGKKVLILDHSNKLAEKIRISGGGRCNFTNINTSPEAFISQNPNFMISALTRYTPFHFMELLDKHNIKYHEKTLGQMFCDNSSDDIIKLLDGLCTENKVQRLMNCKILKTNKTSNGFILETSLGEFHSECIIIATGGLSIPKIGATNFGYEFAKKFDLNIIPPKPGLVPMTLNENDLITFGNLAGISFNSITSLNECNATFKENTLITHRGLSGPAILQISSYWQNNQDIIVDLIPEIKDFKSEIESAKQNNPQLNNFLANYLSSRLSNGVCEFLNLNKPIRQLSHKELANLESILHNFKFRPNGTEGYKKAEVTVGGIDTKELSSKTMMSNKVPGLFFIGEVVDVTGWLGGYNFQWAWSSAAAAANSFSA